MGDVGISADKTLLHCMDDVESCCLGVVLPCAIYGQNRKRIGAQGCCAGTMVLMVPLSLFALVALFVTGGIVDSWEVCADLHDAAVVKACNVSGVVSVDNCDVCPVPKDCETFVDSEACSVPFPTSVYVYGWGLGVIAAIYSVLMLAQNRSLLQRTLGMRDEGIVNYLVYLSLPLCAMCQEARAVRSRAAQLEVQTPMAPGGRGKTHRLDFERQEEPEPEGISLFMYVTIIALFVGYWYIVIVLYFYGMLNSSTGMIFLGALLTPLPCIAIVGMRYQEVHNRRVLREMAGGDSGGPTSGKGRGWKWVYEQHPSAPVYDASAHIRQKIGCRSDRLNLQP